MKTFNKFLIIYSLTTALMVNAHDNSAMQKTSLDTVCNELQDEVTQLQEANRESSLNPPSVDPYEALCEEFTHVTAQKLNTIVAEERGEFHALKKNFEEDAQRIKSNDLKKEWVIFQYPGRSPIKTLRDNLKDWDWLNGIISDSFKSGGTLQSLEDPFNQECGTILAYNLYNTQTIVVRINDKIDIHSFIASPLIVCPTYTDMKSIMNWYITPQEKKNPIITGEGSTFILPNKDVNDTEDQFVLAVKTLLTHARFLEVLHYIASSILDHDNPSQIVDTNIIDAFKYCNSLNSYNLKCTQGIFGEYLKLLKLLSKTKILKSLIPVAPLRYHTADFRDISLGYLTLWADLKEIGITEAQSNIDSIFDKLEKDRSVNISNILELINPSEYRRDELYNPVTESCINYLFSRLEEVQCELILDTTIDPHFPAQIRAIVEQRITQYPFKGSQNYRN